MSDEADQAQARSEAFEPFLIANSRKPEGPKPTGECHYCGDSVEGDMRWCDKDCRSDYEALWRAGKI